MEKKIKDSIIHLNEYEEILYTAEKNKIEFYFFIIVSCIVFVCFILYILNNNLSFLFPLLFKNNSTLLFFWGILFIIILILISIFYVGYLYIIDFLFTNVFLTNKRVIIIKLNEILYIDFNQIKNVYGSYGSTDSQGNSYIMIELKSGKSYKINFVNPHNFARKFNEICSNYGYKR